MSLKTTSFSYLLNKNVLDHPYGLPEHENTGL